MGGVVRNEKASTKGTYQWATTVFGGDQYFANWHDAMLGTYGDHYWKGGKRQKRAQEEAANRWQQDRDLQNKEFKNLKNYDAKTVDYESAITDELTTEEERIKAAVALEEEEELLGKRMGTLGNQNLRRIK